MARRQEPPEEPTAAEPVPTGRASEPGKALITGNIGLYYACYRLSQLGWNVMPTARNARGIDIIAYHGTGFDFLGLQVKALAKAVPVPLGNSLDRIAGDYWIIVAQAASAPACFIMKPDEVKTGAHRGEKNGVVSYWLQPRAYDKAEYREQWQRIRRPGSVPDIAAIAEVDVPPVVILEVGAEGGSVTLQGRRLVEKWEFRVQSLDQSARLFLGEGDADLGTDTAWVDTWEDALALLDHYSWVDLYPLQVRPEFARQISAALQVRLSKDKRAQLSAWKHLLSNPGKPDT